VRKSVNVAGNSGNQAFPEMPRQLREFIFSPMGMGLGVRGWNPLLGHVKS